jgi:aminopeptidase N
MKKSLVIFAFLISVVTGGLFAQQEEHISCCNKSHHHKISPLMRNADAIHPAIHGYDVRFYFLDIELTNTSTYISGSVRIDAVVTAPVLDTFVVELIPALGIDSARVNGQPRNVTRSGNEVYITGFALIQGAPVTVEIWYEGNPSTGGGFFSGISTGTSPSWGAQATWTLSEPFNASQWWPSKQVLEDKADSAWIFITTPAPNKAGSNGLLTNITSLSGNKLRYEWKTRYPINYYLISASVSTYQEYNIYAHPAGYADSILIQNYLYNHPNLLPNFKSTIDQTVSMLELFSEKFGLYPFAAEKYGHCMAPMGGGMEHQTMTTLGSFTFNLVAHELGHQWFGDLVTCATWQDIWINEGFASYTEYVANQYLKSHQDAQNLMAGKHSNVMSQPGGSVFVPIADAENVNRIFSGRLSYDKGAAILHMIRYELDNDSLFFAVLEGFLGTYANGVASGDDFRVFAENLSGIPLQDFFDQWYYGEGYPLFQVRWAQTNPATVRVITQQTTSSAATPFFKMDMDFRFISPTGGDTTCRLQIRNPVDTFFVPVNRTVNSLQVDPDKWMLAKITSIHNTTGLEEPVRISAAVFPNPAKEHLTIRLDNLAGEGGFLFLLSDLNGRAVMRETLVGSTNTVRLNHLNSGVYHWQIITPQGYNSGKLIVQ